MRRGDKAHPTRCTRGRQLGRPLLGLPLAAALAVVACTSSARADVVMPCSCNDECHQITPSSVCVTSGGGSMGTCCPGSMGCPSDPGPGVPCPQPDASIPADAQVQLDSAVPPADATAADLNVPAGDGQPPPTRGCACDAGGDSSPLSSALVAIVLGLALLWRLRSGRTPWRRR